MPQWAVYAKRLNAGGTKAAVLAINIGDTALAAGAISVSYAQIFGTQSAVAVGSGGAGPTSTQSIVEYDLWAHSETARSRGMHINLAAGDSGGGGGGDGGGNQMWASPELDPQSSFFATLEMAISQ